MMKAIELGLFALVLIFTLQASGIIDKEIIPKNIVDNILLYFTIQKTDL